jgi:hypothetical protein
MAGKCRIARLVAATAIIASSGLIGALSFVGTASATPVITVTPNTGLSAASIVKVSGTGLPASASLFVLECNDDQSQPTITALGNTFPVGCSNPHVHMVNTDSSGDFGPINFTIVEGVVGPPITGTDSGGNPTSTDTVLYPCPPTAAQIAIGDSCDLQFGDTDGVDLASQDISFGPANTTTTTTSAPPASTTTTTTTAISSPTTTTVAAVVASDQVEVTPTTAVVAEHIVEPPVGTTKTVLPNGTLAFTGAGPGVWATGIIGFLLLNLGFLVMLTYRRPRELTAIAGRRISRIFGGE